MKYFITILVATLLSVLVGLISYYSGHSDGEIAGKDSCAQQLHQSQEYWKTAIELDESFLRTLVSQSNAMQSGSYIFESKYHRETAQTNEVDLVFVDGQLKTTPTPTELSYAVDRLQQNGNVVSWQKSKGEEQGYAYYVGVIDGNRMWGRMYTPRIDGWYQNAPAIGVWRMYPKSDEPEL